VIDAPENSVQPRDRAAWRAWLAANHGRPDGVWLVTWKKASGKPRIEYGEAVEEALCFGWIDSKPRALDSLRTMLWFAPRKPRTGWSAPNKKRIATLIAAGLMAPAGMAKVAAAKRDGSWTALDAVEALEIPTDLAAALARSGDAAGLFAAFPRSVKRGILEWIANARRPETRARRIAGTARLAERNERANQWRPFGKAETTKKKAR
jgi:uncharacterized protein YdeI (YjbR/CyaY-like superfamily)